MALALWTSAEAQSPIRCADSLRVAESIHSKLSAVPAAPASDAVFSERLERLDAMERKTVAGFAIGALAIGGLFHWMALEAERPQVDRVLEPRSDWNQALGFALLTAAAAGGTWLYRHTHARGRLWSLSPTARLRSTPAEAPAATPPAPAAGTDSPLATTAGALSAPSASWPIKDWEAGIRLAWTF